MEHLNIDMYVEYICWFCQCENEMWTDEESFEKIFVWCRVPNRLMGSLLDIMWNENNNPHTEGVYLDRWRVRQHRPCLGGRSRDDFRVL